MEQARRILSEEGIDDVTAGQTGDAMADGLEKVLRFSLPGRTDGERSGAVTARDFATAIDMVHEAAETMKAAESRARDADARTQALAQRATDELKSAEMRIQAAEGRARAAEARAQDAEARSKEAESWLRQIFSTITEEFPARR